MKRALLILAAILLALPALAQEKTPKAEFEKAKKRMADSLSTDPTS